MTEREFVAALAARVEKQTFPDYVDESPADIATTLATNPEVFISGELGDGKAKLGQSKVGGKPDVPNDFEWPCEEEDEEAPLQFIAQINLAEVRPHDFKKLLPAKGMLWFFSIADGDRAYGGEIDSSTTKVIYAKVPGPLHPHDIPATLAEDTDAEIEEHPLELGPTIGLGAFSDAGITEVIETELRAMGGKHGPWFMLNVRDEADDDEADDDEADDDEADDDEESPGTLMLADIDCYRIAPNAFGEGILGFTLTEAQLKDGALGEADTVFEAGS